MASFHFRTIDFTGFTISTAMRQGMLEALQLGLLSFSFTSFCNRGLARTILSQSFRAPSGRLGVRVSVSRKVPPAEALKWTFRRVLCTCPCPANISSLS